MLVVGLVEENIFSVFALSSVWLEDSIRSDSVFCAQLLPEFVSDLISALSNLESDNFSWHIVLIKF